MPEKPPLPIRTGDIGEDLGAERFVERNATGATSKSNWKASGSN
jgi:hypothetical protein